MYFGRLFQKNMIIFKFQFLPCNGEKKCIMEIKFKTGNAVTLQICAVDIRFRFM